MSKAQPRWISKLRRLGPRRLFLLVEAAGTIAAVTFALRVLPFKRAIRLGSVKLGHPSASETAEDCVRAVQSAGRRSPWRTVCIHQGIAAQRMLRRRGIEAVLHYGIANREAQAKLEAHVWVTVDGKAVVGGAEAPDFSPVAAYP